MVDEPIRPRTEEERKAFTQGYAQALIDVSEKGFADAQAFLKLIADTDKENG